MNSPFNTLFGRLAVMTVGLIVLVHVTSLVVVDRERHALEIEQLQRIVLLAERAKQHNSDAASAIAETLGMSYVDVHDAISRGCPPPCADTSSPFARDLRRVLLPGSHVVSDSANGMVWVRYPSAPYWITVPRVEPSASRHLGASTLMLALAIVMAVLSAWHFQRPLRRLARAARDFRTGAQAPVVESSGPREVRELIGNFNQMVHELARTEQDRAVMLAGLAHDLRAPITRIQVRSDLLPDPGSRTGFLRDAESLSRIVTQFLDFVRNTSNASPLVNVDAHCRRHYGDSLGDDSPMTLDARAGAGFNLPLVDLDRILSNLIENALTYGRAPVQVTTSACNGEYTLRVRDHGAGIPAMQVERASQPFVRLDAARGGDAHCGLGLAIVRRLTSHNGGTFAAANAADGGFVVTMTFSAASR
jgi:two-component system osmolarity sensor histidine kinase EnvZ